MPGRTAWPRSSVPFQTAGRCRPPSSPGQRADAAAVHEKIAQLHEARPRQTERERRRCRATGSGRRHQDLGRGGARPPGRAPGRSGGSPGRGRPPRRPSRPGAPSASARNVTVAITPLPASPPGARAGERGVHDAGLPRQRQAPCARSSSPDFGAERLADAAVPSRRADSPARLPAPSSRRLTVNSRPPATGPGARSSARRAGRRPASPPPAGPG